MDLRQSAVDPVVDGPSQRAVDTIAEAGVRTDRVVLSVCIPTHERVDGLLRALDSVTGSADGVPRTRVELLVSDNGTSGAAQRATRQRLQGWPGPARHVVHDPPLGMVGNFNACIDLSGGEWVFILHDDDYLTGQGLTGLFSAASEATGDDQVMLLGVDVVDGAGRRLHRQCPRRWERLPAQRAVRWLLSDSSSVRFPAMLVRRSAYEAVGPFDAAMSNITDYDMWLRLFSRFGVTFVPRTTSAYVVHPEAATSTLFSEQGLNLLDELFRRAAQTGILTRAQLRHLRRNYYAKFLLAGAYRHIRAGEWAAARDVIHLLESPRVTMHGRSRRWAGVRHGMKALVAVRTRGRTLPPSP